ncbi:3-phenylpropionate dioxygenase [Bordetella trematum]|uniref:Hydroxylating subunit beta of a dioxygenase system n=1 Tax=Bordetella trematum TaxID=123899 RepID=A0A157NDR2_9BORD|nr:3-phenylpropionate/cinnamic acid dioxygenase subunit beta [Bordetella trematum]AZR93324.1 3-phenylpropionate dioxygenase [Bordetella trematum]NNH20547.1 3-phenylpropionate/cinnamic acid dioxygenase subunit beta [Bordetella trematum]SAI19465.1 hydroxylating subunit beta of a dioxygenase system [Bordetella trematum]SAI70711.1 hydroxylating subunit beta of a dioxygenase system [Bordetella trematum]SUV98628.1 hydroxylating subunit beta of a dioxygenase system [Bordetella trematum]
MTDTTTTDTVTTDTEYVAAGRDLWWEIQDFFFMEADLLDTRQFDAWLALLHPQIEYRMPLARNVRRDQRDHEYTRPGESAWFDEGIETLSQRVAQINTGIHWAEEPASRISHLITNVRVFVPRGACAEPERVQAHSRFLVYQNRLQTETNLLVGRREDLLLRVDGQWRIRRRLILLNQNVLTAKALTTFF